MDMNRQNSSAKSVENLGRLTVIGAVLTAAAMLKADSAKNAVLTCRSSYLRGSVQAAESSIPTPLCSVKNAELARNNQEKQS